MKHGWDMYVPTDKGWLYPSAIEVIFRRRVVGWSMDIKQQENLQ